MNNKSRFIPLLLALCVIGGILIGTFYARFFSGGQLNVINTGSNKLNYLLQHIDNYYVDTVDINEFRLVYSSLDDEYLRNNEYTVHLFNFVTVYIQMLETKLRLNDVKNKLSNFL